MEYPYQSFVNATAQDVETFIREVLYLSKYPVTGRLIIEKENCEGDETGKRFTLYFIKRQIPKQKYDVDEHWGGAEIIEWSKSTEIKFMWANTHAIDEKVKQHYALLEELHKKLLEKFGEVEERNVKPKETAKPKTTTIENTRIPAGKYDELCIRWVNRPYIPKQNKDEFLSEHASDLNKKTFDRILEDAYKREIIGKVNGRYKPKTVS